MKPPLPPATEFKATVQFVAASCPELKMTAGIIHEERAKGAGTPASRRIGVKGAPVQHSEPGSMDGPAAPVGIRTGATSGEGLISCKAAVENQQRCLRDHSSSLRLASSRMAKGIAATRHI